MKVKTISRTMSFGNYETGWCIVSGAYFTHTFKSAYQSKSGWQSGKTVDDDGKEITEE
jgi:hypothetical protein